MSVQLVTGPVRSGKSAFAAQLAASTGLPVCYVATARRDAGDPEWEARLERHARERPAEWMLVETAGMNSSEQYSLLAQAESQQCLLIDSLGTWVACAMDADASLENLELRALAFADALIACEAHVVIVGEQVGWDVVPASVAARTFRDILGRLQQRLALRADHAYLVVAGYAIDLTVAGQPVLGTEVR